jgi:hypothetical protein
MTNTTEHTPTADFYTRPREHPPKPRLTVRIGVTGHRLDVIPPKGKDQELRDAVHSVLNKIKVITKGIFAQQADADFKVYSDKEPCLRVISPLAEGTDRLVAEEALKLDFELQCPLPFAREEYATDFVEASSKQEFIDLLLEAKPRIFELDGPTAKEHREEAYEIAGRTVLRQCDILIAIWDPARPLLIGGTGQIVQEALARGLPVVWFHPLRCSAPALLEAVPKLGKPEVTRDLSLLSKRLDSILRFPSSTKEMEAAQRFFGEEQPTWNHGFFYRVFCKFWVWRWEWPSLVIHEYQKAASDRWKETWKILRLEERLVEAESTSTKPLETGYLKPFAWADGLADFYANNYRSSFVVAYLMSALAILFAFQSSRHPDTPILSIVELVLIVVIVVTTMWGRSQRWHQRWMDYRALAEEFRQIQFLSLLGLSTSSLKVPTHLEPGDPRNKWFEWYFRAITRENGMIKSRLDSAYLDSYRQVLDSWIKSQRSYHNGNAAAYHKLCKHLQFTTQALFFATLACCLLHLVIDNHLAINDHILISNHCCHEILVLGTIVFPAFGSALGAILHIGEFERIALRSGALNHQLETLDSQLRCIGESGSSRQLGDLAQSFSDIALAELVDWRFAAIDKDLNLPA